MLKNRIYPVALAILLSVSVFFQGMYTEGGKYTAVVFGYMIAVAVLFGAALWSGKLSLKPQTFVDWFIVSCVAVYLVSTVTAVSLWDATYCLSRYIGCYLLYFTVKSFDKDDIRWFYRIVFYLATVASVYGLYLGISGDAFDYKKGLLLSVFKYHNTSAVFFAVAFIVGLYLVSDCSKKERVIIACCNTLLLSSVVYTQSRGTWLVLAIALVINLLAIRKKESFSVVVSSLVSSGIATVVTFPGFLSSFSERNVIAVDDFSSLYVCAEPVMCVVYVAIGLAIACVISLLTSKIGEEKLFTTKSVSIMIPVFLFFGVIIMMFFAPDSIVTRLKEFSFGADTVTERFTFFRDATKIFCDNPITGIGGDGWKYVYPSVQSEYYTVAHPHNYLAEMMTDSGILGILLYLLMIVSFVLSALKNKEGYKLPAMLTAFVLIAHTFFDFDTDFYVILSLLFISFGFISSEKTEKPSGKLFVLIPLIFVVWSGMNIIAYNASSDVATAKSGIEQYSLSKKAVDFMPINSDYLTIHGNICRMMGKTDDKYRDEALAALEKAHKLNSYHYETINQLAYSYLESGDYKKACDTMKLLPYNQPFIPKSYEYLSNMFNSVSQLSVDTGDYQYADYAVAMFVEGYEHGQKVSSECRARIEMGTPVHEIYAKCCIYGDMRAGRR